MKGVKPPREIGQFVVVTEMEVDDRAFAARARLAQVPRIAFVIEALRENDISIGNASFAEARVDPKDVVAAAVIVADAVEPVSVRGVRPRHL